MPWTCFGIFSSKKKGKDDSLLVLESKPYDLFSNPDDTFYQAALAITKDQIIPVASPYMEGFHYKTVDESTSWVVYHNTPCKKMAYALYLLHNEAKNIRVNFTEADTKEIHAAINSKQTLTFTPT